MNNTIGKLCELALVLILAGSLAPPQATQPAPGTLKWRFDTRVSITSSAAIDANGTIYVGSRDFYAFHPDGILKWQYPIETGQPPVIGADGTIYVTAPLNLHAFHPNGALKWSSSFGIPWAAPALGADGTIYFGSWDGYFYALYSSSPGLANTPWPIFRHDHQRTGRASMPSR